MHVQKIMDGKAAVSNEVGHDASSLQRAALDRNSDSHGSEPVATQTHSNGQKAQNSVVPDGQAPHRLPREQKKKRKRNKNKDDSNSR